MLVKGFFLSGNSSHALLSFFKKPSFVLGLKRASFGRFLKPNCAKAFLQKDIRYCLGRIAS
jgi:hypothetical protein